MTDTGWMQTFSWLLSRDCDGYELTVTKLMRMLIRNKGYAWAVWTDLELIAAGSSCSTRTAKAAAMRAMRKHRREPEAQP